MGRISRGEARVVMPSGPNGRLRLVLRLASGKAPGLGSCGEIVLGIG